jgi:6-pyruvoyltetrahydropterin/6-carboxytetrahydropterin synthase
MIVNLSDVAERIRREIEPRYDHRFLNRDTPPFDRVPPTVENLARRLLEEGRGACADLEAPITGCHLMESDQSGAIAYADGRMEREIRFSFSAARRTCSPHLTDEENAALFGSAASPLGHGHGYLLRIVLAGPIEEATGRIASAEAASVLDSLHKDLDHRNLNVEFEEMRGVPMTSECLALTIHRRLARSLTVSRIRLSETADFFAETDGRSVSLGMIRTFSAAHRLHNPVFTDDENRRVFGKCNHPSGHGHRYAVEATVTGEVDPRTGIVFDMVRLERGMSAALSLLDRKHLDLEVEEFRAIRSTSENILRVLTQRLDPLLDGKLTRLRVQETENNRFALRSI